MKNLVPFILIVFVFSVNAQTKSSNKSAPLTPDSPESVGMSSERLTRIDAMCQEAVKSGNLPGIVALVARNGKIRFSPGLRYGEQFIGKKNENG